LVLFADADTRYEAGFIDATVSAAETDQIDFLSVYLKPEFRTLGSPHYRPLGSRLFLRA
jgi:hypothetical protein